VRRFLLVLGALALTGLLYWSLLSPSRDRPWSPDQSVLPWTEITGDSVRIHRVRNFHWTGGTSYEAAWEDRSYRLDQVTTVWYVLVPFSRSWRGPAHAFVTFGFDDGRYLAISVEARREVGEIYGVVKGLLRRFELIYVIGDERDLIGRRAVYDDTDVYLYPIQADRAGARAMLTGMLERANQLHQVPEFYNTITNNCTLNLVRHANRIVPGGVPAGWRVILPGYSDEVARSLGLIDSSIPLAEAREKFRINDRARAASESADFSRLIRE
jgi:Domain of unknown function (DUF4105)